MVEPTRIPFLAGIFGLFTAFFAFFFAGGSSGKPPRAPGEPPQVPPAPSLPSTLPPPAEPPQVPPAEPPGGASGEPSRAGDPGDLRSAVAVASFYPKILEWLAHLHVPADDRQDLAQEVVIQALRNWHEHKPKPEISEASARRGWLFGVTSNVANYFWRRHFRRAEHETGDIADQAIVEHVPSDAPGAEELFLNREAEGERGAEADLEALRATTTPERWTAFFANAVEGLTLQAIAAACGESKSTIATRVRDAKADMRAAILRRRAQRKSAEEIALFKRRK